MKFRNLHKFVIKNLKHSIEFNALCQGWWYDVYAHKAMGYYLNSRNTKYKTYTACTDRMYPWDNNVTIYYRSCQMFYTNTEPRGLSEEYTWHYLYKTPPYKVIHSYNHVYKYSERTYLASIKYLEYLTDNSKQWQYDHDELVQFKVRKNGQLSIYQVQNGKIVKSRY